MKFNFSLLFLFAFATTLSSQQSLFDKALRIDSLYDQIRGGQTELADQVFAELRDLYPEGEDLTDDAIYSDVSGQNSYLAPKMNYVHSFLEDNREQADSSMAILKRTFSELIEEAAIKAEGACAAADYGEEPEGTPCPFGISIESLREYPSAKQLAYLRSQVDVKAFASLVVELKAIEIQLYEIDVQLDLLKRQDEAALRLSGSDGGIGLPVGGSADVGQAFGPIVVQSGGGSAQGALIDGASRWIAERMREELSIAFFDRFEIWMEEQKMVSLFPSTVRALDITSTTDYSLMMQILRSAFESDLEELPFNIGPFIRQEINNEEDMAAAEEKANTLYKTYRSTTIQYAEIFKEDIVTAMGMVDSMRIAEDALASQLERMERTNNSLNYILFSIAAIQELSEGSHPANLLSLLNQRSDELFPHGGKIRPVLMLADVLTRSFIRVDPNKGTTWLRRKDLTRLSRDQQLREFYFGLIFHELRQNIRLRRDELLSARKSYAADLPYYTEPELVLYGDSEYSMSMLELLEQPELLRLERELYLLGKDEDWLGELVVDDPTKVGGLLNELSLFTERMDNMQQQYAALRATGQANLGNPQLVGLIRHSLTVLKPVFAMALDGKKEKLDQIQELSQGILDAYTGVLERDYDAVVLNVIPVAGSLLDIDYGETLTMKEGELPMPMLEKLTEAHGKRQRKLQEVFRYSAFLAAVATSRSPEDIKQAIRAIALPPGSYSIKRRSFSNISLNTYPGLTGGMELVQNDIGQKWAPNFGFTAPVGLAFSWGYRGKINNKKYLETPKYRRRVDRSLDMRDDRYLTGHSGSLFFSLIDLGAVVLFRLDGSDNSLPEDVGFQQVFSPGVIYSHGFPNLPVSVLAGAQISPQLRKFGDAPADAIRMNFGITVDLPMANFHTRSVERER
ncbi:MAG: hypothetical protein AB8H12_10885 [Lewinella sp.]